MAQVRQDLPLALEAQDRSFGGDVVAEELERDLLLELPVRALGQIHRPHAAVSQLLDDPIRPDVLSAGQGAGLLGPGRGCVEPLGRVLEQLARRLVRLEQEGELAP